MRLMDAADREHAPFTGIPRIVSLVPSLTELLCDLGLSENLAGRTGFCIHPRDTYISAMLAAAGWDTLSAESALRYPEIEADAPWLADIDRVLLSTEPYRFTEKHLSEAKACFGRPAQLIDGEMVSWYGSRAIAGLRYLARLRQP